ncbi:hypothetical protein XENOCAPTIV_022853, partial [Xenoophorus captivus]
MAFNRGADETIWFVPTSLEGIRQSDRCSGRPVRLRREVTFGRRKCNKEFAGSKTARANVQSWRLEVPRRKTWLADQQPAPPKLLLMKSNEMQLRCIDGSAPPSRNLQLQKNIKKTTQNMGQISDKTIEIVLGFFCP